MSSALLMARREEKNRTNVLTNTEAFNPLAKIPEFKVNAVNIAKLSE